MLCNLEAQPHNLISALFGTPGTLLCPMGLDGFGGSADDVLNGGTRTIFT
jgi:hypothetical protein